MWTDVATARAARGGKGSEALDGEGKGARRDGATGSHCLSVSLSRLGCEFEGGALQDVNSEGRAGEEEEAEQGKGGQLGESRKRGGKLRKRSHT